MTSIYQSIKGCIFKGPTSEQVEIVTRSDDLREEDVENEEIDNIKENDVPDYCSDKKTDEMSGKMQGYAFMNKYMQQKKKHLLKSYKQMKCHLEPGPKGNLLWRMSSGLYNTATGAVGYGVGGVKWVAGKSYNVGSAVVTNVKVPSIPKLRRKDKKE